jgi:hypothetical protein
MALSGAATIDPAETRAGQKRGDKAAIEMGQTAVGALA